MNRIKQAILNPLLIMEYIMGVGFPNEAYPYTNTIYFTFIDLVSSMLPYQKYEKVLDLILEHNGVTEEILDKLSRTHFQLDEFMRIIELIKKDLMFIYVRIAEKIQDGSDLEDKALEYRRLINAMWLEPNAIYPELRAQQMYFSDKALEDLSIWLSESVMTIAHNALNHNNEKVGRIFMYQPEHSKRYITEFQKDEHGRYYIMASQKDKIRTNTKDRPRLKEERIELVKQVRKLDKEAGVDLKNPTPPVDTPNKFERKVNNYKYALAKYLFKLNKMKLKKHLDANTIFGMEVRNIEINQKFRKMSPWFDKCEVEVDDTKFMIRFISYLFAWVIRHLTDVAEICFAINKDHDDIEFESKMDYVKNTVKRAVALADKVMKNENIEDDLLYFEELMMCMESSPKTKKKVLKNCKNFRHNAELLITEFKGFPNIPMYSQDIQMDTMVKLAYMISTHDIKMRAGLEFHEGYKFNRDKETKEILIELGKAIHKARRKYPCPPMFRYFVESDPIVMSQFSDVNENQNLGTGIMAMSYLAFVINDSKVKERIESII